MRILAGLQESKVVENLLPTIIKEEQLTILKETQRIKDEQKTVISHLIYLSKRCNTIKR